MSLVDAVKAVERVGPEATQAQKKHYSELLSRYLAEEVASELRNKGFVRARPAKGGASDKEFQGGLGPKRVDVSVSDERHGLLIAVSVKTIGFPPFGKNLNNRFGDLCTEAITLHMRFPYAVVCALFAFPDSADSDKTDQRTLSTFRRAVRLFSTISGRDEHTGPSEKFENATIMLYGWPDGPAAEPSVRLVDVETVRDLSEEEYFELLCDLFVRRNPHFDLDPARR